MDPRWITRQSSPDPQHSGSSSGGADNAPRVTFGYSTNLDEELRYIVAVLEDMSHRRLRIKCRNFGLRVEGTRQDLIARLREYEAAILITSMKNHVPGPGVLTNNDHSEEDGDSERFHNMEGSFRKPPSKSSGLLPECHSSPHRGTPLFMFNAFLGDNMHARRSQTFTDDEGSRERGREGPTSKLDSGLYSKTVPLPRAYIRARELKTTELMNHHWLTIQPADADEVVFEQRNVQGDGNCMLRAFAHSHYGNEQEWLRVRNAVSWIWAYATANQFSNTYLAQTRRELYLELNEATKAKDELSRVLPSVDWRAHLEDQIKGEGNWGTDEMLQLIADAYDVCTIAFFPCIAEDLTVSWGFISRGPKDAPQRFLVNHRDCYHWTALKPKSSEYRFECRDESTLMASRFVTDSFLDPEPLNYQRSLPLGSCVDIGCPHCRVNHSLPSYPPGCMFSGCPTALCLPQPACCSPLDNRASTGWPEKTHTEVCSPEWGEGILHRANAYHRSPVPTDDRRIIQAFQFERAMELQRQIKRDVERSQSHCPGSSSDDTIEAGSQTPATPSLTNSTSSPPPSQEKETPSGASRPRYRAPTPAISTGFWLPDDGNEVQDASANPQQTAVRDHGILLTPPPSAGPRTAPLHFVYYRVHTPAARENLLRLVGRADGSTPVSTDNTVPLRNGIHPTFTSAPQPQPQNQQPFREPRMFDPSSLNETVSRPLPSNTGDGGRTRKRGRSPTPPMGRSLRKRKTDE